MENISKEYSFFKFKNENRVINKGLVKRLKESIAKIGYMKGCPIIITKDRVIIDGQHRFIACKELGLPIYYYVMDESLSSDEVLIALNQNQQIWRLKDYVDFYSAKGIDYHRTIQQFSKNHKLNISNSICICTKGNGVGGSELKSGKNVELNIYREEIADFIHYCKMLPFCEKKNFVWAVCKLFTRAKPNHILKIKKYYMSIQEQPSTSSYISVFENLANRNVRDDKKLIF